MAERQVNHESSIKKMGEWRLKKQHKAEKVSQNKEGQGKHVRGEISSDVEKNRDAGGEHSSEEQQEQLKVTIWRT